MNNAESFMLSSSYVPLFGSLIESDKTILIRVQMMCRVQRQKRRMEVACMTTKWMKSSVFCAFYAALF